jgi:hypothetical protein
MRKFFLLLAAICPIFLRAELPPSTYESLQKAAPELLDIEVLRVEIEPGAAEGRQNVFVMALVGKVVRTGAGLKEGDLINISYLVTPRKKGWTGPGEIPILEERDKSVAYLVRDAESGDFHPAAGAMSFRNF